MTRVVLAAAILWSLALVGPVVPIRAQQLPEATHAAPEFDVASIKPNRSGEEIGRMVVSGGLFRANNVSVRALIAQSFGNGRSLFRNQIAGGPEWVSSDRFDIIAKADGSVGGLRTAALQRLIRRLLEDRFQLRVHTEKQEQPVYALIRLRPVGSGPSLKPSAVDCSDPAARAKASAAASPGELICLARFVDGGIDAGGYTMSLLASTLSSTLDRMVIDETGLAGSFDLSLKWNPDPGGVVDDRPSLFTAIEEQLGLNFDARRMPVDVVVIDEINRPTPD